mgnify:CR=1 FL=1
MNIIIHRGTHQIGGSAIEISTASTRIILDFGNELSLDEKYTPINLDIDGITKGIPDCEGIIISHYHMDHLGQLTSVLPEIPLYMGALSKEVAMIATEYQDKNLYLRLLGANIFRGGEAFTIGDIRIRPLVIDHSAADSYMFVIEAEGKRILYTGDFRLHGLRSHCIERLIENYVGTVDVLITEGTTLSRNRGRTISEAEVLDDIISYVSDGKYVFIMRASTNIDRIMGIWQNLPDDKVLLCDRYQKTILDTVIKSTYYDSSLYKRHDKPLVVDSGAYPQSYMRNGFVSLVRCTDAYINKIKSFNRDDVRIIYSMWTGYIDHNESLKELLDAYPSYICHSSGHVTTSDLITFIDLVNPDLIIPIHTESPESLERILPHRNIRILNDKEVFEV